MSFIDDLYGVVRGMGETAYNNVMRDARRGASMWTGQRSVVETAGDMLGDYGSDLDNLGTLVGLSESDKNQIEYGLSSVPFVGDVIRARDGYNYIDDYLRNTGLTWADVKYPSRVTGSGGAGSVINSGYRFVSKNIDRLYR